MASVTPVAPDPSSGLLSDHSDTNLDMLAPEEARERFAAYVALCGICSSRSASLTADHLLAEAGEHAETPTRRLVVAISWAQSGLLVPGNSDTVVPFQANPMAPVPAWNRRIVAVPREIPSVMPRHRFIDPVEALVVYIQGQWAGLRRVVSMMVRPRSWRLTMRYAQRLRAGDGE